MRVMKLATGLAVGYVLGSRAGREKYEQIVAAARKAQGHPAVTQAQEKAKALIGATVPVQASADPAPSDAVSSDPAPSNAVSSGAVSSGSPVSALPRPPRRQPRTTSTTTTTTVEPLA